jgi:23S rRNA-/tRNA-specific pseudouridylate synthase
MTGSSLVEVLPKTGRMHQIRVHLFSIGHPIIGDKLYKLKNVTAPEIAPRQLLHAKRIDFEFAGEKFSFEAPLPADFLKYLAEKGVSSY